MSRAKELVKLTEDETSDVAGLVTEFSKHMSDALSALAKIQTVTAKNNAYTSVLAKELIEEFGKAWKKSEVLRSKYRKP
jgi:hypothetical protein